MGKIAPGTASRSTIDPRKAAVKDTATRARAAGISVVPPSEDGEKKPDGPWKQFQSEPAGDGLFAQWYGNHTGVGWVCGAVSGGLECLEFDDAPTYDRYRERAQEVGVGDLVERVEAGCLDRSPGGGIHWYYYCDKIQGNTILAGRPNPTDANPYAFDKLIETRGEGGYIVVAPSYGKVHPSGRPYVLDRGGVESIVTLTSAERNTLWDLAKSFDERPKPAAEEKPESQPPLNGGLRPGDDYAQRHTWEDVLGEAFTRVFNRGDTTYWRRAGKSVGISATTNHGGSDRLWVFSTSTSFAIEKSYTKFGAFAQLHHQGNHSAAAKELKRLGYGASTNGTSHHANTKNALPGGKDDEGDYQNDIYDRWPKIPPAAFHGIAGKIVAAATPHSEADPIAILLQFLAGFANALGRGPHWITGATKHYMALFVALVGTTSSGRKGSAWDVAEFFLRRLDSSWVQERVTQGLSTGEGLIHHVRDRVYVKEDGEEKCVDPGVDDKRLLAVETELGRTFKSMSRQGNTLSAVVRQAWDCRETLSTLTKNSPTRATGAHVGIIGHITDHELNLLLADTEAVNGFGNRFLWICSRRSKSLPDGGEFYSQNWLPLLERLEAIYETARHVGHMRRDAEATVMWREVYPDLSAGRPGILGAMLGRAEPQVMRLACVYALLDGLAEVKAEHLSAGLAIWEYAEASAKFIFGESLGDEKAEKLLAALRAAPDGLKRSEIGDKVFAKNLNSGQMKVLLEKLFGLGLIYPKKATSGPGRTPERWFAGRPPHETA